MEAFDAKRVVHAGLNGRPLSPEEAQQTWQKVMATEPVKGQLQSAYIHIPILPDEVPVLRSFFKTRPISLLRTVI
mgnify:CR=1 FL=1